MPLPAPAGRTGAELGSAGTGRGSQGNLVPPQGAAPGVEQLLVFLPN